MTNKAENTSFWRQHSLLFVAITILILSLPVGCGPSTEDLEAVDYTPLPRDDWEVSTPAEQGLDPMLVAELYPTWSIFPSPAIRERSSSTAI
jgi:hypothetical protein